MEFNFILPENFKSQTLKDLLEKTWLIPRKQRHFLRMKKHLLVNNEIVKAEHLLFAGDAIQIIFDKEDFPDLKVRFGQGNLTQILYEDEHLVIANKPERMKTHGNSPDELALQNHVAAAIGQAVYVVHRLDEATSGAVLFAKNQLVLPILGKMFENNDIHREYLALVEGNFTQEKLTINQPIGRNRHDRGKQIVSKTGKNAVTHLTVLKIFHKKSLLKIILDTGRTHQIRVHLSFIGNPIIGDSLYGQKNGEQRLMLHAHKILLKHPFTDENLEISAPSQSFERRCEQEQKD